MTNSTARRVRLIVVSDPHMGGEPPVMMSRPDRLASFIHGLPSLRQADEDLELVIAGDVVDFLAIPPRTAWTPAPVAACDKLARTMRDPSFAPVFEALGRHVAVGHGLTVLLGNHDLELALPQVQEQFLREIGAGRRQVVFVDDGRAYRVGGALIEHGNRYDGANANDWDGLRAIASALSRGEPPPVELRVTAGSLIVEKVVNVLKPRYPFLDLLQPQGELVALLLLAFEPQLVYEVSSIAWLLYGRWLQGANPGGRQPGQTYRVAGESPLPPDPELLDAFGPAYNELRQARHEVGVRDWLRVVEEARRDSLSELLRRGEPVPAKRLKQIRVALRKLLLDDRSDQMDGPTEQYGRAAERLIQADPSVQVVLMGHTHLPRQVDFALRGRYINTGTWIDRIRVPATALADGADRALEDFLRGLLENRRPDCPPTYADLRIDAAGRVERAELLLYKG
jgi:UDP-2,3-diacylglucosamine pyrophosphatase LpxH